MRDTQLIIGNKNYSSWSLRAWLCLKKSGVQFEEIVLPLDTPEFDRLIGNYSPTRCVPVLCDQGRVIWDSLAICEYSNERFAGGKLWPEDSESRAMGRSMACEMHSGFPRLRSKMPMNCRALKRVVSVDSSLREDIDRMVSLLESCLARHAQQGPWLLGQFSITDAMFAPVVMRIRTYGIAVPHSLELYCRALLSGPDVET